MLRLKDDLNIILPIHDLSFFRIERIIFLIIIFSDFTSNPI